MASRNNHFDAQISHTDKVLFCLGACRLSAENGKHVSVKSVTKEEEKTAKQKTTKKKQTASLRG